MRLARVLDDRQAELGEPAHVGQLAVEVHRHHEAGALRDRSAGRVDVHVEVGLGDVDGNGSPACLGDGLERRDERVRRDEHLVARLQPGRDQGQAQRVETARYADASGALAVGGERLLEGADGRAVGEGIRIDQPA